MERGLLSRIFPLRSFSAVVLFLEDFVTRVECVSVTNSFHCIRTPVTAPVPPGLLSDPRPHDGRQGGKIVRVGSVGSPIMFTRSSSPSLFPMSPSLPPCTLDRLSELGLPSLFDLTPPTGRLTARLPTSMPGKPPRAECYYHCRYPDTNADAKTNAVRLVVGGTKSRCC